MPTTLETVIERITYAGVMCSEISKTRLSSTVTSAPDAHAHGAARQRQHHGLNQNLQHDVAMARAQRLAHADFARALGDAHQHDVHDDDAAHHQRNARHRHHDRRHHAEQLIDEAADGVGRKRVEVIVLARVRMKSRAQRDARQIERILQA